MNFICVTIDNRREEGLEACMFFLADARRVKKSKGLAT